MPFVDNLNEDGVVETVRLATPEPPKSNIGALHPPDTMGLRVIFAPIEGMTYGNAFAHGKTRSAFVFQAPPLEEFQESHNFNHSDFSTVFAGERSRAGGRALVEISFNTLWLDDGSRNHAPDWVVVKKAMDPLEARDRLVKLGRSMRPFWVMAHQMPLWHRYDLRMTMTMRSISSLEKHGEEDARYFSIALKEYRGAGVATRSAGRTGPINRVPPGGMALVLGRLKADEQTLYRIATKYYGTSSMWKSIKAANPALLREVGPSTNLSSLVTAQGSFARYAAKAKIWLPPRTTAPKPPAKQSGGKKLV